MSFWNNCFGWLWSDNDAASPIDSGNSCLSGYTTEEFLVNPASGLPMIGGMGGVDVEGNLWGTDLHDNWHSSCLSDTSSSFGDDGWSNNTWQDDSSFGNSWNNDD